MNSLEEKKTTNRHFWRQLFVGLLIFLGCLFFAGGNLTNWLRDVVLDTDEWVATVSPLSQSPIIAHSLSVLLVDELFNEVSEILPQDSLPPELSFINVAYDELIRDFAIDVVASVIQSDEFHEVWSTVNRALHEVFISVLRSERTFLYVEE